MVQVIVIRHDDILSYTLHTLPEITSVVHTLVYENGLQWPFTLLPSGFHVTCSLPCLPGNRTVLDGKLQNCWTCQPCTGTILILYSCCCEKWTEINRFWANFSILSWWSCRLSQETRTPVTALLPPVPPAPPPLPTLSGLTMEGRSVTSLREASTSVQLQGKLYGRFVGPTLGSYSSQSVRVKSAIILTSCDQ